MTTTFHLDEWRPQIEEAAACLNRAKKVAVLTGAGVSAESGIPTFRDADGLWEGHSVEAVATPQGFTADPELVWRFYNARRANLAAVKPNPGHEALAALEEKFGSENFTVATQNVDGLHRAAGSRNLLEVHGSLRMIKCSSCDFIEDRGTEAQADLPKCPNCEELLRPAVVWFGEMLPQDVWMKAETAAQQCDCFLVVGTSAVVWPAAGLVVSAKDSGASVVEINMERTAASSSVDVGIYGPSGKILPAVLEAMA